MEKATSATETRTNSVPGLAVVIGGGNGIGEATCRRLRARGWKVVVADKDAVAAERVAAVVDGTAIALDICDSLAVEGASDRIERTVGAPTALVVAAAVFQDVLPPERLPLEVWQRTFDVNLTGTFLANRAFGVRMAMRGHGSIVNIASIAALGSMPVHAYGTSKAAVVALTRNLAGEWGRAGVRVNVVSPGSTLVPRIEERLKSGRYADDPGTFTALGRMVRPNEVAETIEFLLSERASAITGQNIVVDAGWEVAQTWAQFGGIRPAPKRE